MKKNNKRCDSCKLMFPEDQLFAYRDEEQQMKFTCFSCLDSVLGKIEEHPADIELEIELLKNPKGVTKPFFAE